MAFDGYIGRSVSRQAARAELLDAETEARLARDWRERGDQAAMQRLVTSHMRLAISMAAKFRRYGAPMDDLIQEASLGLMRAAERFDPDRGVRFSTYAAWWIRAAIQDHVMRNWSLVRTGSTSGQKALFFNLRRVQARLEREAREAGEVLDTVTLRQRVAAELGVTEAEVEVMEGRLSGSDLSLDAPQGGDPDGRAWVDALEDESPQTAERVEAAQDTGRLRGWLARALAGLSPRERYIVTERRLKDEGRTLDSLGAELGLSKERVRQLEAAAFARLRRALDAQSGEARLLLGG